jgi:phosphohistidine phosphatase SixA
MILYLVRHGIAIDREDPDCPPETERYLTRDGIKKTREVAKGST